MQNKSNNRQAENFSLTRSLVKGGWKIIKKIWRFSIPKYFLCLNIFESLAHFWRTFLNLNLLWDSQEWSALNVTLEVLNFTHHKPPSDPIGPEKFSFLSKKWKDFDTSDFISVPILQLFIPWHLTIRNVISEARFFAFWNKEIFS